MKTTESIAEYSRLLGREWPAAEQIAAYRIEDTAVSPAVFRHVRRDFYKLKLLTRAHGRLCYADQQVEVSSCALIFVNPRISYSWQELSGDAKAGYTCLFTEAFSTPHLKTAGGSGSPLFRVGGTPVVFPPAEAAARLSQLFEQLLAELASGYAGRHEVAGSYLHLILHEARRLAPAPAAPEGPAAVRLSARFLELLARQFPVLSPQQPLRLRTAGEFARQLAIHPNHLNRALQATTGQTTTAHLAGRLADEARALLRHSDWSLADISYCLGFGHPANFAAFFKKQTGQPPHAYRRQLLALS